MEQKANLGKYGYTGLAVGLLGTIIAVAMMSGDPIMAQSYLFAWTCFIALTLGMFGLMLLHHTLRGKWGLPVLRIFEAGGSLQTFGLMALLFIPVLIGLYGGHSPLYSWSHPDVVAADKNLQFKSYYLNAAAFTIRFAAFFLLWIGLAWGLRRSTLRQDSSGDVKEEQRRCNFASPGLAAFFLSLTFAGTDWMMSLEPHWSSTLYGLWWSVQTGLAGLSVAIILLVANRNKEPYAGKVTPSLTRDLGNLGLTLTMLWGYTSISQYLIIWSGNIPEYTKYFVNRSNGSWNMVGFVLIIGQFFIPFFALITPRIKAVPTALAKVAIWILVMRLIESYYLVMPAFGNRKTPMPAWEDAVAWLGVAGLWVWAFSAAIRRSELLPSYDPRLTEREAHAH